MASRNSGCQNCGGSGGRGSTGHGGKKGGKFWWWVIGTVAAVAYFGGQSNTGTGSKDYVPPGQHQTTQKKCDPNALFQMGCTP